MVNQYSILIAHESPVAAELWGVFGKMQAPIRGSSPYLLQRSNRAAYMIDYVALDAQTQQRLREHCQNKSGDAPGGDWDGVLSRNGWPVYTEYVLAVVDRDVAQDYIGSDLPPAGCVALAAEPAPQIQQLLAA